MAGNRKTEYEIAMLVGGQVQASFGNSINMVGDGFDKLASMAQTAAKVAAASFGAIKAGQFVTDAVQTYAEFEQSMANTAAVAGATKMQYDQLEKAARDMGKATTKTASEAADALGYMMLAGWDVNESIMGLEPVLRLSEATQMDLATCSDLVTDSMSALGLSVESLEGYLDVCAAANNSANTSAEALMEAFIGCGGAAKTIGADLNGTATALGILANNGKKGAEAGTALNAMLVRMTSKDAARKAMKELGVSAFDTSGNFIGLEEVLIKLQGSLSKLTDEEQAYYMSQIAGTNYYTEMSYLLDAVAVSADGTASAWEDLSGKLVESDGALMDMADTVTDTLSGSFSRLESAVDDAKISFADAFSDDLKDTINGIAGYIPEMTDKLIVFSEKAGPKVVGTFDMVTKAAGNMLDIVSDAGGWAIDNFDLIEKIIAGVGGAIITYKVVSGLTSIIKGIKGVHAAIKAMTVTNPWLLGITLAASAIGGIASAMKAAEKQAVKSNLAEHFGDIALSMDDIAQVADHIIMSDSLVRVQESLAAFGELDGIQRSMQDSVDAMNKMNWKLSIGMDLSQDESASYEAEIQNYYAQVQAYVEQERYALDLGFGAIGDLDPDQADAIEKIRQYYADKDDELKVLGEELSETITEAFADGFLDIDEAGKIAELQQQMANIAKSLATSDFDAQLKIMELEYSGANLDSESFQALQERLAEQEEIAVAQYKEALGKNLASARLTFEGGGMSQTEYDDAVNAFWQDYLTQAAELQEKSMNFQTETIMKAYGEELDPAMENYMQHIQEVMGNYEKSGLYMWGERPAWDSMLNELEDNDLDKDTRKAIESLLESMQPSIEQMEELKRQYEAMGVMLPESMVEAMNDVELLKAMTGDAEGIYHVLGQQMEDSEFYNEVIDMLTENGAYVPEAVREGMESNTEEVISMAVDGMYAYSDAYIQEIFSQPFDVEAGVNISMNPNFSTTTPAMSSGIKTVTEKILNGTKGLHFPGHADGGIFTVPHMALFAEDGPEAAIPIDGSGNAISLWEKVGQLLGVFEGGMVKSRGEEIYSGFAGGQASGGDAAVAGGQYGPFIYSPQIHIDGNADRETVAGALRLSAEEFREYMEQYLAERERTALG